MKRPPASTVPGTRERCAHCEAEGEVGPDLVPFGRRPHAWLHDACWAGWFARQQENPHP